jgi:hypothetical protein|eukprot:g5955.t1
MSNSAFSHRNVPGSSVPTSIPGADAYGSNPNMMHGGVSSHMNGPGTPMATGGDPSKSRRRVNDAQKVKNWIRTNQKQLFLWLGLVVAVLFVYHVFSDGDFSFLLTLGSLIRTFAFIVLAYYINTKKTVAGVSLKFLQCYMFTFIFRLSSILFYEGYLPYDKSGDYMYQVCEVLSLLAVTTCIFFASSTFNHTYEKNFDIFGNLKIPSELGNLYALLPTLGLALIFHPSLNSNFLTDTAWTWALCLESVAILPQIIMFTKRGGTVDEWTSHVVAALGMARFFQLIFWISSYHELNDKFNQSIGGEHVGHFVVASQVLQLLLMCDYFYFYMKALKTGRPMIMHPAVVADAV